VVIRNGVDEDDFLLEGDDIQPPDDRFRLTYVGSLYGDRDAAPVIDALGRLVRRGRIDPGRFELSIVGNVWLSSRPADDVLPIKVAGYVDRAAALRAMRGATVLLFYAPESTWAPSGKIFEYLVAGRPVLSVARRDNLAYQLVAELGAGAVATPSDPAGIERAVVELYDRWRDGSLTVGTRVREETLRRFSRRRLTTELVRTFEDAIAQPLDG
jgi:glycosyltransferase involved in cell wall biosynthesis